MKRRIYISIIIAMLIACSKQSFGQVPTESIAMQSPNVASMSRYDDVAVSLFNGIPQIDLPIYEIKIDSNTLPITLSYHAAGIMPEQHPGWTGTGWTLFCGGSISRIVNGLPDEYSCESNGIPQYKKLGFYYTHDFLDNEQWYSDKILIPEILKNDQFRKDTQPDKFSFRFNDCHGTFYIDHQGKTKVKCNRNVTVEIKMDSVYVPKDVMGYGMPQTDNFYPFTGFVITTDDGTRYTFGMNDNAVEYSINFWTQQNQEWIATAWHLTQISYPDGKTISFKYDRGQYICQLGYSISNIVNITEPANGISQFMVCDTISPADSLCIKGHLISPSYLKQIDFAEGNIRFSSERTNELSYNQHKLSAVYDYLTNSFPNNHYLTALIYAKQVANPFPQCLDDLQWRKLTAITINDTSGKCIRNFKFEYTDNPRSRLMLNGFSDETATGTPKHYKFEYNNPDSLPPYLSQMVDHWGYYNGKKADTKDPQYFNNRESDPDKIKYGILKKITYPNGEYTRLEFEANRCMKIVSDDRTSITTLEKEKRVGGLRIKRICDSSSGDTADEIVTKEYFYVNSYNKGTTSSGVLNFYPKYELSGNKFSINDKEHTDTYLPLFSAQSVLPGGNNALGSHIGYTEVIEINANGTSMRYNFTNFDTGVMDVSGFCQLNTKCGPYDPYFSNSEKRGLLSSSETFNKGWISTRIRYTYDEKPNSSAVRSVKAVIYKKGNQQYADLTSTHINTATMQVALKTKEIFEPGKNIPTVIIYPYNKSDVLTKVAFDAEPSVVSVKIH